MHTTRTAALLAAVLLIVSLSTTSTRAVEIDGATILISWDKLSPTTTNLGQLSGYTYDSANDTYYAATFGNFAGLHKITRDTPGDPYEADAYVDLNSAVTPSSIHRFIRATNVPNGVTDANDTATTLIGGILLNPTPITVSVPTADAAGVPNGGTTNITYQAGELAFIADGGAHVVDMPSNTTLFAATKKIFRWDLRKIGDPTSEAPDYSTGTSGSAADPNPGGLYGALGKADWNDVFAVVMTEQAMRSAYTAKTGLAPSATSSDNFSRQPVWSSNGQFLYTIDTGNPGGGLYKTNVATGVTTMLYSENSTTNVIAEPAVVSTSVRNFGSGFGSGDQIMFDGNATNGNAGGISYVVDTGSSVSGVQTLFTAAQLTSYTGRAPGAIDALASDVNGNVYFFEGGTTNPLPPNPPTGTSAIHMFDTAGRFRSVLNRAQLFELNETNDGLRANSGTLLRLQTRQDGGFTTLTYRGDNKYVGAVRIFDGGDVDRDGDVDQADRDFFISQINKTFHQGAPNPHAANNAGLIPSYIDYINADLNGDSNPRAGTAALPLPGLMHGGVDYLDLDVLKQFTPLLLGDFNWDGSALSALDWAIFNTHYNVAPGAFDYLAYSLFDGDVTGAALDGTPDGLVNDFDLQYLLANASAGPGAPEPSTLALAMVSLVGFTALRRRRDRRCCEAA